MSGWFKVHRGWMGSPDFQAEPFTEREAFLWSIEQAAFEPHLQWFNGHEIAVGRGEFATSSRKMAAAFQWGEKRVRLFLSRMERRGKWAQRTAQEGAHLATILKVCNYDFYQASPSDEGAAKDAAKGAPGAQQGRTEGAQHKNGEEGIEGKEGKASPSPALPYPEAVAIWSEFAARRGWKPEKPQLPLADKRRKGLAAVLKAHGLDGWRAGLQRAADSELLGGPDPRPWFNFSFVCNLDNFNKVQEGNYDRSFDRSNQQRQSSWGDINAGCGGSAGAFRGAEPPKRILLESNARAIEG